MNEVIKSHKDDTRVPSSLAEQQKEEEEQLVVVQKYKSTRHLVLNKPRDFNCIWIKNVNILYPYLKVWQESSGAKLIYISGTSTSDRKIFSAGGDIKSIAGLLSKETRSATDEVITNLGKFYELLQFVGTMNTPIVGIMDGITMGTGSGLIGQVPFRIATENTVYAMPKTAIGSFADSSTTFTLSRFDGNLGLFLGLTGSRIFAEDVLFCGLASHLVYSSKLEEMKRKLADLENSTHGSINAVINKPSRCTLRGEQLNIIERCFKYNTVEEIVKALELDGSKFALSCVKAILQGSPTSLKVIMESLRRAGKLSYNACIRMEFRVWQRMPYTHDLKEGMVGHVLGKRVCNWSPNRLEDLDVEDDVLVKIFEAVETHQLYFTTERDLIDRSHSQYSLPSAKEIEQIMRQYNFRNIEDAIAHFEEGRPGKFGVRQKVKDYLERKQLLVVNDNAQNKAKL